MVDHMVDHSGPNLIRDNGSPSCSFSSSSSSSSSSSTSITVAVEVPPTPLCPCSKPGVSRLPPLRLLVHVCMQRDLHVCLEGSIMSRGYGAWEKCNDLHRQTCTHTDRHARTKTDRHALTQTDAHTQSHSHTDTHTHTPGFIRVCDAHRVIGDVDHIGVLDLVNGMAADVRYPPAFGDQHNVVAFKESHKPWNVHTHTHTHTKCIKRQYRNHTENTQTLESSTPPPPLHSRHTAD